MDNNQLKYIVEAALLAAGRPLSIDELQRLFGESGPPARQDLRAAVMELQADYAERGISVKEVASGFRMQVDSSMSQWLEKLWEERPPRYSRALMETLAIIAYRQPVTRGDVEDIRGVSVTTNIIRTLLERNWIREVGHRDVPGKPAMFGTTKEFLDYFDLKKLDELPTLEEIKDLDKMSVQLYLPDEVGESADVAPGSPVPLIQACVDDEKTDDESGGEDEFETSAEPATESATVSSIEDARAAAADSAAESDVHEDADLDAPGESTTATVVPLKTS
jgi:segregation and condensation protein B